MNALLSHGGSAFVHLCVAVMHGRPIWLSEAADTSAGWAISLAAKEYTGEKLAVVGDHTIPKRHQPNERRMGSDPSQARMPSDLFKREQDSPASRYDLSRIRYHLHRPGSFFP